MPLIAVQRLVKPFILLNNSSPCCAEYPFSDAHGPSLIENPEAVAIVLWLVNYRKGERLSATELEGVPVSIVIQGTLRIRTVIRAEAQIAVGMWTLKAKS